ncbi:MAG: pyocin knob domain-containing protein [Pseudomonadota bacterium]
MSGMSASSKVVLLNPGAPEVPDARGTAEQLDILTRIRSGEIRFGGASEPENPLLHDKWIPAGQALAYASIQIWKGGTLGWQPWEPTDRLLTDWVEARFTQFRLSASKIDGELAPANIPLDLFAEITTMELALLTTQQQEEIVEGKIVYKTNAPPTKYRYSGSGDKTDAASYDVVPEAARNFSSLTGTLANAQVPNDELAQAKVNGLVAALASKAAVSALAAVAMSGAYGDLSGRPPLSAVAISGDAGDLTGTLPEGRVSAAIRRQNPAALADAFDLDTLTTPGLYIVADPANRPAGATSDTERWIVEVVDPVFDRREQVIRFAKPGAGTEVWRRMNWNYTAQPWQPWERIDAGKHDAAVTQAQTRLGHVRVIGEFAGATLNAQVANARSAMGPRDTLVVTPGSYTQSAAIDWDEDNGCIEYLPGVDISVTADVEHFRLEVSDVHIAALTADYVAGSRVLAVASLPAGYIPEKGDWIELLTNAVMPSGRDYGDVANDMKERANLWVLVQSATATQITLEGPVMFPKGGDPASAAGEEGLVDAFTLAMGARVLIPRKGAGLATVKGHPTVTYEDGHGAGDWSSDGFVVIGLPGIDIDVPSVARCYGQARKIVGCPGCTINGAATISKGIENDRDNGHFGYAFGDNSGGYGTWHCGVTYQARHAYTSTVALCASNETNPGRLMGGAYTVSPTIYGEAFGDWGADGVHWDGHHGLIDPEFHVTSYHPRPDTPGFQMRGLGGRVYFDGEGWDVAIRNLTEYAGGDLDDDFYTNFKGQGGLSTLRVEKIRGNGTGRAAVIDTVSGATTYVEDGVVMSASMRMFSGKGRAVVRNYYQRVSDLNGRYPIVEPGVGEKHCAVETDVESTLPGAPYGFEVVPGGLCALNAKAATKGAGALALFNSMDAGAPIAINGHFDADLSDEVDEIATVSGAVSCGATGLIEYGIEGAADSAIIYNFAAHSAMRIASKDGSAAMDGVDVTRDLKLISARQSVGVSSAGDGTRKEAVWTLNAVAQKLMDRAGPSARALVRGKKVGSVAAGPVTFDFGGAYNFDFTLPATADVFTISLDLEVFEPSGDPGNGQTVYWRVDYVDTADGKVHTLGSQIGEDVALASIGELWRIDHEFAAGDTLEIFYDRLQASALLYGAAS